MSNLNLVEWCEKNVIMLDEEPPIKAYYEKDLVELFEKLEKEFLESKKEYEAQAIKSSTAYVRFNHKSFRELGKQQLSSMLKEAFKGKDSE